MDRCGLVFEKWHFFENRFENYRRVNVVNSKICARHQLIDSVSEYASHTETTHHHFWSKETVRYR